MRPNRVNAVLDVLHLQVVHLIRTQTLVQILIALLGLLAFLFDDQLEEDRLPVHVTDGVVEAEGIVPGQLLDLVAVQVVGFLKVSKEDSLVRIRQVEIDVQVAVATVDHLVLNVDDLAEFYVMVKTFAFTGLERRIERRILRSR